MFKVLALTAALILCAFPISAAPKAKWQAPPPSAEVTPQQLLIDSYLAALQAPLPERAYHLVLLCAAAARIDRVLDRLWAEELFQLSFQLPLNHDRVAIQKNALTYLSFADPDRAMELWPAMDRPQPVEIGVIIEDVRAHGAQTVFANYWKLHGTAAVERLRMESQRMGDTGEYPYQAWLPILRELSEKDPALTQQIFDEAVSYFGHEARIYGQVYRFSDFLKSSKAFIPKPSLDSALRSFVSRLPGLTKPHAGEVFMARAYTEKGVTELHNPADVALLDLISLLREVDAAWVLRLIEDRPELKQTVEQGAVVRVETGVVRGTGTQKDFAEGQAKVLQFSRLREIEQLASTEPDKALTLANTLTDGRLRALALAAVARGFGGGGSTERALSLLLEARKVAEALKDPIAEVEILFEEARTRAAMQRNVEALKLCEKSFDLGVEEFNRGFEQHPGTPARLISPFDVLRSLTELGIRLDANTTLSWIHKVRNPLLRAHLLTSAAQALDSARKKASTPAN